MMVARLLLMLLACAVGAGAAAGPARVLPGIVGDDDRQIVSPREYPWSAVGRLNTGSGPRCTGTLVAPDRVATAAHCLFNRRTGNPVRPESVHFLAGYGRGEWLATARAVAIRRGAEGPPGDPARDWAIVTLARPIGRQVGWIAPVEPVPGAVVGLMRAGYGQDRAHLPMAVLGCAARTTAGDRPVLIHDCDAVRGDSGSALLAVRAGRVVLLGIHSGHARRPDGTVGVAASAAAWRPLFRDWPDSRPPPAGAGVDPQPTRTVRELAGRTRRTAPVPSLEELGLLLRP